MFSELLQPKKQRLIKLAKDILLTENLHESNISYTTSDISSLNQDLQSINSPIRCFNTYISFENTVENVAQIKNKSILELEKKYRQESTPIRLLSYIITHPNSTIQEVSEETFISIPYIYNLKNKINDTSFFKDNNLTLDLTDGKIHISGTHLAIAFFILYFSKYVLSNPADDFKSLLDINIPTDLIFSGSELYHELTALLYPELTEKEKLIEIFTSHYNPCLPTSQREYVGELLLANQSNHFTETALKVLKIFEEYYPQLTSERYPLYIYELYMLYNFFVFQTESIKYYPPQEYFYSDTPTKKALTPYELASYSHISSQLQPLFLEEHTEQAMQFFDYFISLLNSTLIPETLHIHLVLLETDFSYDLLKRSILAYFKEGLVQFVDTPQESDIILCNDFTVFSYDYPIQNIYYFQNFFQELASKKHLNFIMTKVKR
ncbi:hypothetical protein G7081_07165 [Vagococcus coleopterorum]|uniref:Mga helix-turn-helix domain-containing protein n=1 Tax=Vagococcus coleopterorum TaxID=2714946 RepID=A0A6G8APD6_9ENTE|nr:helix-turn-helix domain-containing protein [Vagococcus coleopterorum]QIL46866.1 hypothetical protein G7081_07165 [Vagococcus coleopterorum]